MEGTKNTRLKEARKAAGLSQSQLAVHVGVTRQTICSIESGKTWQIGRASCRERV